MPKAICTLLHRRPQLRGFLSLTCLNWHCFTKNVMMKMRRVFVARSIAGMKIVAISLVRYFDCAMNSTSCSIGPNSSSSGYGSSIINRQSKSKSH